jgi:hypothetical protein
MKLLTNHIMSKEIYEKYLRFNKQNEINRNPKLKFCPVPNCEGFLEKNKIDVDTLVKCAVCDTYACFMCLNPPHPGETCDTKLEKEYHNWATPK